MEEDEMTSVALLNAESESQSEFESENEDVKQGKVVVVKRRRLDSLDIILYLSTCAFILILTIYYSNYNNNTNTEVGIMFYDTFNTEEPIKINNTSEKTETKPENLKNEIIIPIETEKLFPVPVSSFSPIPISIPIAVPVPSSPVEAAVAEVTKLYHNFQENETDKKLRVMNVFILTTWRSGSSFFGEAMSSHPQIFYHFEPLMSYDQKELESGPEVEEALNTLTNLSSCLYENLNGSMYMLKLKTGWNLLTLNNKISSQCKKLGKDCFSPAFLNPTCQLFPIKLFKLVRLRGRAAETILEKFENAKIIYLVRDPRGTYASRMHVPWCGVETSCGHIENFCKSLTKDLEEIQELQKKQQRLIQVIRYEDVVWNPLINFKRIFSHLGVPWDVSLKKYLDQHTHSSSPDPMSTVKVSKLRANIWKKFLPWKNVNEIQNSCHEFIMKLNYPIYTENEFNSIQNDHKDDIF